MGFVGRRARTAVELFARQSPRAVLSIFGHALMPQADPARSITKDGLNIKTVGLLAGLQKGG
jgi:hypothetical protein